MSTVEPTYLYTDTNKLSGTTFEPSTRMAIVEN